MTAFSRYNEPDDWSDPDDWQKVCEITGDIDLFEDPSGRLFIDAVDMEEMAGEITVEKAKQMMTVLMRLLSKFEGAKVVSSKEEKK